MATRTERVILDCEDNLTPTLARAAVASSVLEKSLNDLDGSSRKSAKGLDDTEKSTKKVGTSSGKAGPEIDRLSGRLSVLRDVAILLGPALTPLGAATIPVLTGSLVAMGAAAGGIGASVLALKGMGDALKALDAYQLEPTAQNLQALRIEMEKLGPAGAHFVRYIDEIEGQLRSLQIAAREGLLPGLEDGIDSALQRLPGVRKVIRELAEGMGELARSAGEDFKPGGDWDNFFHYLDTDGKQAVVGFGSALGDIANGLADLLVAFAPLSRDFQGGFEGMAQAFADWAANLDSNKSFQDFLDYIRTNGPKALDFLESLVTALAGIVEAFAPIGAVTLPILTKFLDLLGKFANSPLGTPFAAAVVGITAYSRAMDLATASQEKFAASRASGLLASPGPLLVVAALAAGVVGFADAMGKADEATARWSDSLESGTFKVKDARAEIEAFKDDLDSDSVGEFVKNLIDPDVWLAFTQDAVGARTEVEKMQDELPTLRRELHSTGDIADLFGEVIGQTGDRLRIASGDAEAFQGAIAELNGWLDKRDAIRNYRESIRELTRTLRNGFTKKDLENVDTIGQSIAQVASQIKDKGVRAEFLEHAKAQLEILADKTGPKGQKAIQRLIDKLTELGLVDADPQVDVDTTKADTKIKGVKKQFDIMDALATKPTIDANANPFFTVFNLANNDLNRFDGRTATANLIIKRGYADSAGTGRGPTRGDDSRMIASRSLARGDDGSAKADAFLGVLKQAANGAAVSLHDLRQQLKAAEKAVEKERRQRDALVSRRDEVRSSIASDLGGDLFGTSGDVWSSGGMDPLAAIAARKARAQRWITALAALKKAGLTGVALQAVIGEGLEAAEFLVSQGRQYISTFSSALGEANQYVTQAQNQGAEAVVSNAELRASNRELREANRRLHKIEKAIKDADKANQHGHHSAHREVGKVINRAARDGVRRGKALV